MGCMYGIEIAPARMRAAGAAGAAWEIADALYEASPTGFFTRPIGNVIQYVPPYCTTQEEVALFAQALRGELERWAI